MVWRSPCLSLFPELKGGFQKPVFHAELYRTLPPFGRALVLRKQGYVSSPESYDPVTYRSTLRSVFIRVFLTIRVPFCRIVYQIPPLFF